MKCKTDQSWLSFRPKKKVDRSLPPNEDVEVCEADRDGYGRRDVWKANIQMADPTCVGIKVKEKEK